MEIDENEFKKVRDEVGFLLSKIASRDQYLGDMIAFHDEFVGLMHHMILDLYKQTGKEFPKSIKDYKMKHKDPRCGQD